MVPLWLARLIRRVSRWRATPRFTRHHARVLEASGGRIRRSVVLGAGQPVLSLTTTGRRSGQPRSTVVAHLVTDGGWAVFGMNLGNEREPAWALNLAAHPEAQIHVEGRTLPVRARRATGDEEAELWSRYVARVPSAARFAEIAGRRIPVFVLEPDGRPGRLADAMPIEHETIDADDPLSPDAEPAQAPVRSCCSRTRARRRRVARA